MKDIKVTPAQPEIRIRRRYAVSGEDCPITQVEYLREDKDYHTRVLITFNDGQIVDLYQMTDAPEIHQRLVDTQLRVVPGEPSALERLRGLDAGLLDAIWVKLSKGAQCFLARCADKLDF